QASTLPSRYAEHWQQVGAHPERGLIISGDLTVGTRRTLILDLGQKTNIGGAVPVARIDHCSGDYYSRRLENKIIGLADTEHLDAHVSRSPTMGGAQCNVSSR